MTSEQLIQRADDAETVMDYCAAMLGLRNRLREIMNAWADYQNGMTQTGGNSLRLEALIAGDPDA